MVTTTAYIPIGMYAVVTTVTFDYTFRLQFDRDTTVGRPGC